MKKSRYTEEKIIAVLKQHHAGLSSAELCRKHGISEATFYMDPKTYRYRSRRSEDLERGPG